MTRALAAVAVLALGIAAGAAPASAQQRAGEARDSLTAEQRALERLRNMRAVAAPDTLTVPADTIEPQTISVTRPGGQTQGAPPTQIERDSIMRLLLGVGGYIGTEYSADRAQYFADSARLELRGTPMVAREGNQLVADSSIIYNQALATACGYGSPVLRAADQSEPIASDTVCFDIESGIGRAPGASTRVQEGATWNVRCDAYFSGDQLYCHDALFTDCDEPYPHYHYSFGAGRLKAERGNTLVGQNVVLRFADVPVFWLPFFVQSLSRGRRSGLLMPRFGINDIARNSSSYDRRIEDVGVYWAINDYMGAELALDWFSNNWTGLRGSFDYNWDRQFLRGGLTYRQFWKTEGGRDFTLSSRNSWQPDERTDLSLSLNYVTSTRFIRQRTFDPQELNRTIDSYGSVNRRFDWGSASLGVSRKQQLSNGTVQMQLPSLRVSVSPLTLFEALPGEERWYSNMTWSGNGSFEMDRRDIAETNPDPLQTTRELSGNVSSRLNLGRLSWGQTLTFDEDRAEARLPPGDSIELAASSEQAGRWNTNLSYEQRLIATSTITPSLSFSGAYVRNDSTGQSLVTSPTRIDFSSSVRLEMFGFWPGFGPFERLRHRVTPRISYNYSPAVRADSLQRAVFGEVGVAEQNRISLGFSQTFEAKYRSDPEDVIEGAAEARADSAAAAGDSITVPGDSVAEDARARQRTPGLGDTLNGTLLTRRQQVATVSLLEISTDMLIYDFVRARDGYGLVNTQLTNSLRSDLLRGLQVRFTHDLFRTETDSLGEQTRSFAPHLRDVRASFSINGNSWLFRVLGLGASGDTIEAQRSDEQLRQMDPNASGPAVDRTESEYGMIGTSRRTGVGAPRGAVGAWNASINYSLLRPRAGTTSSNGNQMVTGNVTFQPTENWTLRWSTGYSFTESEFANHVLTLTRTLHDWDANFDFVKAQNGNFSFQFRVHLRANPDVKLDYQQNDVRGLQGVQ